MTQLDLKQIKDAVARDPSNAELRYLLGAELAQQKEYDGALVEIRRALELDPTLHYARFQLGLLYLTMAQPNQSITTWAPLETLEENAALKYFKRGLEALIRDDFDTCAGLLRHGIELNTQNAPLNRDMKLVIDRLVAKPETVPTTQVAPVTQPAPPSEVRTDFSLYGDPSGTKH
jgi:tetratricopeptide (TPR) repeat protein